MNWIKRTSLLLCSMVGVLPLTSYDKKGVETRTIQQPEVRQKTALRVNRMIEPCAVGAILSDPKVAGGEFMVAPTDDSFDAHNRALVRY